MPHRTVAIGDIHGHLAALNALVDLIDLTPSDTLVLLGDYIDRGPQSAQVIQRIIDLSKQYRVIAIRGNHEEMLLQALKNEWYYNTWMSNGGDVALESYGGGVDLIPESHLDFLDQLPLVHELDHHFFVHASFTPNRRLDEQLPNDTLWGSLDDVTHCHFSGKIAVVGHTPQFTQKILDRGYLKCLDTACGFGGVLTAYDLVNETIWQVTEEGQKAGDYLNDFGG
jgi:serine/threonine protein phosphatase 1